MGLDDLFLDCQGRLLWIRGLAGGLLTNKLSNDNDLVEDLL